MSHSATPCLSDVYADENSKATPKLSDNVLKILLGQGGCYLACGHARFAHSMCEPCILSGRYAARSDLDLIGNTSKFVVNELRHTTVRILSARDGATGPQMFTVMCSKSLEALQSDLVPELPGSYIQSIFTRKTTK